MRVDPKALLMTGIASGPGETIDEGHKRARAVVWDEWHEM